MHKGVTSNLLYRGIKKKHKNTGHASVKDPISEKYISTVSVTNPAESLRKPSFQTDVHLLIDFLKVIVILREIQT